MTWLSAKAVECAVGRLAALAGGQGRRGRICVVAWLMLGGLAGPASAQLSSEDIAALRERGQREGWTFTVCENPATKYSLAELCGSPEPARWQVGDRIMPRGARNGFDPYFNWCDLGGCTPVRSQGGCGSCWAFAAIGVMESDIKIKDEVSRNLSEQWLVSCTLAGNCGGGSHSESLKYLRCNGLEDPCGDSGAVLETDFPYEADDPPEVPCDCPYLHPYCLADWGFAYGGGGVAPVEDIKQAILTYGPVSVSVYANAAFQGYGGGVFNACENDQGTNHAVVLVGWDDNEGTEGCWILRNSWGSWWGDGGYMLIEYGCSLVGTGACWSYYIAWDCNDNGIADSDDIAGETSEDCNSNTIPDECDIAEGTSTDENSNDIPDECEDCNGNEVADETDIAQGTSLDFNGNDLPDECEDCNGNEVPDFEDPSQVLFQNAGTVTGTLNTTAPVAQDVSLAGRAMLREFTVYYRSTGSTPGVMMVRFFDGGADGSEVPVYAAGLIGEYDCGQLLWTEGDTYLKSTDVEPALWLPGHIWMEVEIEQDAGVILRTGPAAVGYTQGLVYDRNAGAMRPDCPLYMGLRMLGVQCSAAACICGDIDQQGGPVDLTDFATFALCFGLGAANPPDCDAEAFICSDLNGDDTVDLTDFATFAVLYGLESTNSPPDCVE